MQETLFGYAVPNINTIVPGRVKYGRRADTSAIYSLRNVSRMNGAHVKTSAGQPTR